MDTVCIIHSVAGRLRIKISMLKNRPQMELFLMNLFSGMDGITNIEVNKITGSILIHYDPELLHCKHILSLLKANDFIIESDLRADHKHVGQNASWAGVALGKAILGWAVGRALQTSGLSFLAALI